MANHNSDLLQSRSSLSSQSHISMSMWELELPFPRIRQARSKVGVLVFGADFEVRVAVLEAGNADRESLGLSLRRH